jgi:hypothetical protein
MIVLEAAAEDDVRHALNAAWRNTVPKKLLERYD